MKLVATTLLLALHGIAAADDTTQCLDASSAAQDLRREKHLVAAREQLLVCARATCPGVVQRDCAGWLAEVEAATPTVVFAVKDATGADVVAARIELDGKPLLEQLTGGAVAIDPGVHALRVIVATGEPVAQQLVIREGEKNRLVEVALPAWAAPPPPAPEPTSVVAPTALAAPVRDTPLGDAPPPRSRRALAAIGLTGGGVVVVAVGVVFGVKARGTWQEARDACGGGCVPGSRAYDLRADARGQATIATAGVLVGSLAIAGGVVLYVTGREQPASPVARGMLRAAGHGVVGFGAVF